MTKIFTAACATALTGATVLLALWTAPAWAWITEEEVARRLAERFGVNVLASEQTLAEGRLAYRLKVMNAGGNRNGAFRVSTVVVDAETGELVSQFHHRRAGHEFSGAATNRANRQPPEALRGHIWR